MIPGTFNTTLIVSINFDIFLVDNNIKSGKNACISKQNEHNLAVGQQKTIKKSAKSAVAQRLFVVLFAINNIYKLIKFRYL